MRTSTLFNILTQNTRCLNTQNINQGLLIGQVIRLMRINKRSIKVKEKSLYHLIFFLAYLFKFYHTTTDAGLPYAENVIITR
ncbi:hypothetical protein D3C85_1560450 [compost metagenome]